MKKRYERNHFKALSNSINKKKLYKKGKEWVIGSLTLLAMTGMGVAVDHTTHADTNAKPATTSVGSTADIENRATALYNHVVANNAVSNNANQGQQTQKKTMRLGASNGNSNVLNYYQQNGYLNPSSNKIEPKDPNVIDYALKNNDGNPVSQNTIYGPDHYATGTPQDQKVYQKMNTPGFQQYLKNDAQNRFNRIKAANDDESFTEYFIASDFPRRGNSDMPNGLGDAAHAIAITSDDPTMNGNSGIMSKEINDYRNAYNKAHGLPISDTNYKFDYSMQTLGPQVGYAFQWGINKVYISIPPRLTVNYTYNGKVISTPYDQRFMYRNWYYNPQSTAAEDFNINNVMDFYNINEDGNSLTREFADYNEVPSDIADYKDYFDFNNFNNNKVYYSDWKDVPAVPQSILKTLPNGYQYTFKLTHSDLTNYGSQVQQVSDYQNSYTYPDAPQYDKSFVINIPLTLNARNTSLKLNNVITFVDKNTGKPIGQWVSKDKGYRKDFDNDLYQFYLNISNPNNYYKSNIVLPNGYVLSGSDASKFQNYIYPPTGYVNGRFNYGANYTIPLGKPAGNTITYLFKGKPVGKWTSPSIGEEGSKDNDLVNVYNSIQSDSAAGMPAGYHINSSDLNNFLNAVWPTQNNAPLEANYGRDFKINVTSWSHVHVYFEDADTGANLMSEVKPGYSDFKAYVDSPFDINSDVPGYQSLFNDLGYHYVGMMHPASSFDGNPGEVHTIDLLYAPNTTTNDYAPVEDTVNYKLSGTNSALSSASHEMTEYSRAAVSSASSMSYGNWSTRSSLTSMSYPSEMVSNHSYYHEVSVSGSLPNSSQITADLDNHSAQGTSYNTDVIYAPDSVVSKPETASAVETTNYYWNNGGQTVSSASTVSIYSYSRSASYDTNLNRYVGSVGSWSVTGSTRNAAQNTSLSGYQFASSFGILPSDNTIENNLKPGQTVSYVNNRIYGPDSVNSAQNYGIATDTVNYLINGTSSAVSLASSSVKFYSQSDVDNHTTSANSLGNWRTNGSFSSINAPQMITSNGVTYHQVSADLTLPSDAQVISSLNQTRSGNSASASFANNVYYAPDSVSAKPESASATTTTYYYWDNGPNNVSSASTVNTYNYGRSASYDASMNSYVGPFTNWSLANSSVSATANSGANGDRLVGSYGSVPDQATIMNSLMAGRNTSYANYVIYAPDSVCDTHDYTSATDTVKYLVSGTSSAVSPTSSSIRFYSRADVMDHTTNHASVSDWKTNGNFSNVNVPQTIVSGGVTYSAVSANTQLPSVAQGSLTAKTANYENDVYYAPVTGKLTVNYVDTTNGNVVKSADAGTMNNGSQWTVSQNYFNQVPNNYTLDNNYDNNANAQLLKTPITVTANGSSTANVYVKPVQTQQPAGPITVHYVTSDSQPVQVNGKAMSDVKFTGQPLNDNEVEKPINGYSFVGMMGHLNYTSYPQDVYVVYKPIVPPKPVVNRGHIHVRYVDDSNHQHEFWSDKFSDVTGQPFNLAQDNYQNRYIPGYAFDHKVENNVTSYGYDSAQAPHIIVVGYNKVPNNPNVNVPQSASATAEYNYLADNNGSLSALRRPTSQSVMFSGTGIMNTQTHQFSSATNWSAEGQFSGAPSFASSGWSLFSSATDIPASVAPGGSYVEDLYYKPVSASSTTPAPSSKASSASSSAKPRVSSSSVAPSSVTPQSMPSVSSVTPSSSSTSSAQPARRSTQAVTKNSSSDVAPSYMKPAHQRVITKKNTKSLMNQLSKLIRHGKHGMTRRQTKLYRKISRKLNRAEYDGIHEARRRTEGLRIHAAVTKRERGHAVRQNVRGLHSHSTKVRRQMKLRQATNAKDQRKGAKKLPQTGEAQSYSALYAMLFVISAVILVDLDKVVDKRRHE